MMAFIIFWPVIGLFVVNEYLDIENEFILLSKGNFPLACVYYVLALYLWPIPIVLYKWLK